jgi:hypothetical protein
MMASPVVSVMMPEWLPEFASPEQDAGARTP